MKCDRSFRGLARLRRVARFVERFDQLADRRLTWRMQDGQVIPSTSRIVSRSLLIGVLLAMAGLAVQSLRRTSADHITDPPSGQAVMAGCRMRRWGCMNPPCSPRGALVQAAVTTLIKEILETFEARRRAKRRRCECKSCRCSASAPEVTP